MPRFDFTGAESPGIMDSREAEPMSPTVFRQGGFRFFFFSREEPRMHVHVLCGDGEAKFWMEPRIELARNHGLSSRRLREVERMIEEHEDEIRAAWKKHFQT